MEEYPYSFIKGKLGSPEFFEWLYDTAVEMQDPNQYSGDQEIGIAIQYILDNIDKNNFKIEE